MLNSFCSTDWLKTSDIVSSRSTLHYITLHYITLLTFLQFGAFVRFFPHIQIFSRLYNLPPRQAFWSSRRPDSLAIRLQQKFPSCIKIAKLSVLNCNYLFDLLLSFDLVQEQSQLWRDLKSKLDKPHSL